MIEFVYEKGYSGGWSDDLGIIADRNVFIPPQRPGWYWRKPWKVTAEMYDWLRANLGDGPGMTWDVTYDYVRIAIEEYAVMFALRFS